MHTFTIQPLVGIGPIKFGMPRSEVRMILADLGQPKAVHRPPNFDCFFQNAFQVSYDEAERVDFIETSASPDFRVLFQGSVMHELAADDVIGLVSQFAPYDKEAPEQGYSYIFPDLQLSLWRSVLPSDPADSEGLYFEAVGVGQAGYFGA